MTALSAIESWPVSTVAAGWLRADDAPTSRGPTSHRFPLASVTKPLVALAVLVAVEEGSLALDQPAGPPGSTVAHLLSHSSGLAPDRPVDAAGSPGSGPDREPGSDQDSVSDREPGPAVASVGSRRIYSNLGFELLGELIGTSTGIDLPTYLREAILDPLGMAGTELAGSPAHGAISTVADLLALAQELLRPTLLAPVTMAGATEAHLPDLAGVLPGFGRQTPNPWGLGFEIRAHKSPHWTGRRNSPRTFGHFGRSGTFLWVDPEADGALVALTDRTFGPWAAEAWPRLSDAVLAEMSDAGPPDNRLS